MNKPKKTETWVIQHKETGEYFATRKGKNSWGSKGAAKNAWANNVCHFRTSDKVVQEECEQYGVTPVEQTRSRLTEIRFPYFDEQSTWGMVNLLDKRVEDVGSDLKRAKELLWAAYSSTEDQSLLIEIKRFLDETKDK